MVVKSLIPYRIKYDPNSLVGLGIVSKRFPINPSHRLRRSNLDKDRIYVIYPQYVHGERDFNGAITNKLFAVGVDPNGIYEYISIDIEEFLCCHYGIIWDNPNLKIPVKKNKNNQILVDPNIEKFKTISNGNFPLSIMENGHAYINRPFAFKMVRRVACYTLSEIDVANSNNHDIVAFPVNRTVA